MKVEKKQMSHTACMHALQTSDTSVLQNILKKNPDVINGQALYICNETVFSLPLLSVAVLEQRISHVYTLLAHNANVNKACMLTNTTALMQAMHLQNVDLVKLLLSASANFNLCDHDGYTALHHALQHNNLPCAKELLERGFDILNVSTENPITVFHAANNKNIECFSMITKYYSDVFMTLMIAKMNAFKRSEYAGLLEADMVEYILSLTMQNPLIDSVDYMQKTPLMSAIELGLDVHTQVLLRAGANVNIGKPTPLHVCLYQYYSKLNTNQIGELSQYQKILKCLLKAGADTSAVDTFGQTPLDFAVKGKLLYATRILIQHQVRVKCPALTEENVCMLLKTEDGNGRSDVAKVLNDALLRIKLV